jgi:predicted nucleic acid-binding Zn ribbon protein
MDTAPAAPASMTSEAGSTLAAARRVYERVCPVCGTQTRGARHRRFCSDRCRNTAHREHKRKIRFGFEIPLTLHYITRAGVFRAEGADGIWLFVPDVSSTASPSPQTEVPQSVNATVLYENTL